MMTANNIEKFFDRDPAVFAKSYFNYLSDVLRRIDCQEVAAFVRTLLEARERGAKVLFMGNGGSAATASHFANDLAIGTNSYRKPFRALSITDNNAVVTAIANDFGYNDIFERQIRVLGDRGDVVVGISASGNSPNLIKAFEVARDLEIKTVALTAFDGGKMRDIADEGIYVPTAMKEYGPAEDAHMILDHLVSSYLINLVKQGG